MNKAEIIKLLEDKPRLTYTEIARRLRVPRSRLAAIINAMLADGEIAPRYRTGSPLVPTGDTAKRIAAIRKLLAKGHTQSAIAVQLGVSRQRINQIVHRYAND